MNADAFIDTNVLLYILSPPSAKATAAENLLQAGGVVSIQVLNEFANVARKKFHMTLKEIRETLAAIRNLCSVQDLDLQTHLLGLDIAERNKFSIYDSMLLAAAQQARCTTFYSEDLSHGQKIAGLTIRDPFRP